MSMPQVSFNTSGLTVSMPKAVLTSELIRAARALLRWEQRDLESASSVSLPTIKRLESKPGIMAAHTTTLLALKKALEAAGVEFIDENGGGPGVRLAKRRSKKS
jgi:transcriptional regulator with XRE-family HTH domain